MIYSVQSPYIQYTLPLRLRFFSDDHVQTYIQFPAGASYYQCYFCTEGKGKITVGDRHYVISPGQGILLHANDPYVVQDLSAPWVTQMIGFDGALCARLLSLLNLPDSCAFTLTNPLFFSRYIDKMLTMQKSPYTSPTELSALCFQLLSELPRYIQNIPRSDYTAEDARIETIVSYMEQHYAEPISLQDLAALTNLSAAHMCSLFKKKTNMTIMKYLLNMRLSHAYTYLKMHPQMHVAQISRKCGFESPSYFGKVFKREVGETPEEYRKNF